MIQGESKMRISGDF